MNTEICPGCGAALPAGDGGGPVHDYVDASASCWTAFSNLTAAGEPALAPRTVNGLIVDAYLCHHHGTPSPQAIQSVAVHLLTLYGVLQIGLGIDKTLWIRKRATRPERKKVSDRFHWLTPPDWMGCPTLADAIAERTPERRAGKAEVYVRTVWARWSQAHMTTLERWYRENIAD